MVNELHTIGFGAAEDEAEELPEYYFDNDYYRKAESFSRQNKELFYIGRTGSGKSAILEMIRQKRSDSLRIINITEEDFAVQLLLSSPEVSDIPPHFRELTFKILWKYIIIVNMLKTLYGDDWKWNNFLHGSSKESYNLLSRFGELERGQKTFTDQVITFLDRIQEISFSNIGGIKRTAGSSRNELYDLFKILHDFEKTQLPKLLEKKYIYVLLDDLDKNWTGSQNNIDLIRCLFICIIELGTKLYGNVKFVVALRTDIFRQLDFHQTEKIRPYITEINWHNNQLREVIELRLTSYWETPIREALRRFPKRVRGEEIFDFFILRTMRRPRDIISFVNLCIDEANTRSAKYIYPTYILAAEKRYSRLRMEALIDEWKFAYPDLETWIDLFAGKKFVINYSDLRDMLSCIKRPIKEVIDILYEVGFLGYRSSEEDRIIFSFLSRGRPGFDHKYHVHVAFFSYLDERAEELGKTRHYRRGKEPVEKQLREDVFYFIENVLTRYPGALKVSSLRKRVLDESTAFTMFASSDVLFRKTLDSAPNLLTVYEAKGISFVKLREDEDNIYQLIKTKEQELEPLEKAISLLDRTLAGLLSYFPNGVEVGRLKHEMRRLDPSFNEKRLGYSKFIVFLKNSFIRLSSYELFYVGSLPYVRLKRNEGERDKPILPSSKV